MASEPIIRRMTLADAAACAEMQVRLIPGSFINALGVPFLRDVYFATLALSPRCLSYVSEAEGRAVGFLVIALDYRRVQRELMRGRVLRSARLIAPQLVRRPGLVLRVARFLLTARPPLYADAPAELLSIAVEEPWQGRGIGGALLQRGMTDLDAAGPIRCRVQAWRDAPSTHAFYARFGFRGPRPFDMLGKSYAMLVRDAANRPDR